MSITPLYSADELDAQIAQAKLDLAAARKTLNYKVANGGSDIQVARQNLESLQSHLEWLQRQRTGLELGHGPQAIIGRVPRG